jgi:hypothetical protein
MPERPAATADPPYRESADGVLSELGTRTPRKARPE